MIYWVNVRGEVKYAWWIEADCSLRQDCLLLHMRHYIYFLLYSTLGTLLRYARAHICSPSLVCLPLMQSSLEHSY